MRVGIVALLQESNTFLPGKTTLQHFEEDMLLVGEPVRARLAPAPHEVGGFFAGLAEAGIEAVPIFAARALPGGVMTADTYAALLERMDAALQQAGPLDGLLVAPHGATVAESVPDPDGDWVAQLRDRFPRPFPIVGTLDLHANVSPRLAEAADVWIAYRTNPHLDQLERGLEAARLLARTLRGEIRPTSAAAFPPFLVNIASQLTSEAPCKPLYDFAEEIRHRPGVLAVSLLLAFPYADVPQLGSSVLITTDNDPALARKYADEIARYWWERREQFLGDRIAPFAAVAEAGVRTGPVCLLDMGDNVGGGSPGDGTILLHELSRQAVGPAFVCLADAESVLQARTAGAGALVCLHVGGKTDNRHGPPFEAEFQVVSLHDGHFQETQTRHGGFTTFDQGPTAIVRHARITIMLTTRRMAPFSLAQLTTFGIEPAEFQVLVAKGVHAPVAAYAPVCRSLIRVDTPGITRADVTQLPFQQRRRPMYPFEPDTIWP